MKEIECKILEIPRKEILRIIKRKGAKKVFDGSIHALYFDNAKGSLTKRGEVLRLRKVGKKVELAYKRRYKTKQIRVMKELETHVEDFNLTRAILLGLGYRVIREIKKRRTSYKVGRVRFEFDKFPRIPLFLEIEAPSTKKIREIVGQLGYAMKDTKTWTTFELLKHYRGK